MLLGQVYFSETALILRNVDGSEVSMPLQDMDSPILFILGAMIGLAVLFLVTAMWALARASSHQQPEPPSDQREENTFLNRDT